MVAPLKAAVNGARAETLAGATVGRGEAPFLAITETVARGEPDLLVERSRHTTRFPWLRPDKPVAVAGSCASLEVAPALAAPRLAPFTRPRVIL